MYTIKVAGSGQKVAVYQNDKLDRVINAGKDTFMPAEATRFAERLYTELNKDAATMTDPAGVPSVSTPAEEHQVAMEAVSKPATGIGGPDIMSMNTSELEKQLQLANQQIAKLQQEKEAVKKEAHLERKARRGLAIAKAEIEKGELTPDEKSVEARVKEITAMSDEDIALTERKTAGLSEFESIEAARRYASAMAVKARIYRQAAEEAMEAGNPAEAITDEDKAAYCENRVKTAQNFIAQEEMDMEMGTSDQFNSAGDEEDELEKESSVDDEDLNVIDHADDMATGVAPNMNTTASKLISLYSKIAKINKMIAKRAAEEGEDEVAEEAKEAAKSAWKKARVLCAEAGVDPEETPVKDQDVTASKLASLYTKVASILTKVAEEADDDMEFEAAEEAEEEAKEAKKNAKILLAECEDEEEDMDKEASDDEDEDDMPKEASDDEDEDDMPKEASDDEDEDDLQKKAKKLAGLYKRIASVQLKVAEMAEGDDEEEVAKAAKCEAEDAEKKANILLNANDDEDEDDNKGNKMAFSQELARLYKKVAQVNQEIADEAELAGEKEAAEEAEEEAKTARKKAHYFIAGDDEEETSEDEEVAEDKTAGSEDDEDEDMDVTAEDEDSEDEDSDEEDSDDEDFGFEADSDEVEDESAQDEPKTARKIASVNSKSKGINKFASVEQNPAAYDSTVSELSTSLWGIKYGSEI